MIDENNKLWLTASLICVIIAYVFMYHNLLQQTCIIMILAIGFFLISIFGSDKE